MASAEDRERLSHIIEYVKATGEQDWCTDVVRNKDGANCLFGHISAMDGTEYAEGEMWEWFEDTWGTTYYVYPINDGSNPKYQQPTPKQRIVAYLEALMSGEEQDMEAYWKSMAELM
jgi:hypothetical protein